MALTGSLWAVEWRYIQSRRTIEILTKDDLGKGSFDIST